MDVWCNKTGDVQVARMELSSIDEIWSNQVRAFFFLLCDIFPWYK
jgi:hypothetical protein